MAELAMLADIQWTVHRDEATSELHVMAQARESSPVIDRRSNHCATPPTLLYQPSLYGGRRTWPYSETRSDPIQPKFQISENFADWKHTPTRFSFGSDRVSVRPAEEVRVIRDHIRVQFVVMTENVLMYCRA